MLVNNRHFGGFFRSDYSPPSLCFMSDAGAGDFGGGSLDSFVDGLTAKLEQAPAGDAPDGPAEQLQQPQNQAASDDADGDDGAPDESQPSAEDDGDEQEPVAEQPLITPPLSWSKEQHEHWTKLPRETQEYLHSREQQRDAEVRRSQNDAAEAKKAIEPEIAAVRHERQRYAEQLNTFIALTEALDPVLAEGQRTDWAKSAAEDPAGTQTKWFTFTQRQQQLSNAVQQRDALLAQEVQGHLAREGQRLIEAVPEWADDKGTFEKARAGIDELRKGAVQRYGFKPEEVAVIRDHRHALMLKDALAYHALKDEREKEQAARAKAAKTVQQKLQVPAPSLSPSPGQSQSSTGTGSRSERSALRKIGGDTSRNLDDRVDAMLAQL